MKKVLLILLLCVVATPLIAQVSQERQILVIPRVEHPQIAKDSGIGGRVTVYVTVDNAGNVVSVGNVSGPDNVCSSVTRADVVALREAAKAAAGDAKFVAGSGDITTSIPLNFDFPSREVIPIKREGEYAGPVNVATPSEVKPSENGVRYTVKAERVFSASNTPPPDYTGPAVSSGGNSGEPSAGTSPRIPSQISGGVLNGIAMNLPRPPYPPAARAVRASGAVTIQVLIDEDGKIFSASAVSGHPLLRAAARQAACGAEFSPTLLMGNPVKVSGLITYNFAP